MLVKAGFALGKNNAAVRDAFVCKIHAVFSGCFLVCGLLQMGLEGLFFQQVSEFGPTGVIVS